ncbi:retrovirus-related Pol polyprotein from transposon opus [Trichonephila clavipes]|nr:retrovirus-related Pol polyprotein from transposon opus [Trichonephila clavipes]
MTEAEKFEASGVSIKIPPFWFDKPEIWFNQVEAQFRICRITSEETMFSHLVAQLEPRVLEDIWDIVKDPNPNKYSATKERLLNIFVESENNTRSIPIAEEDKEKTAITTPFGLYELNTMSFGLRNAPSTFQRFITEVLYGLDFVFSYLDDVLVASSTEEEHSEHLKMVFERFQQYGLRINVSKSVMGAAQVEYLGFLITAEGSRPLPEKVQAILSYKLPETIHDLRTFLGMINFYRRYLKDAAKTQAPLHELLKGAKEDRRKVYWTDDTRRSCEKCKTDLAEAALLSFPRSGLPLSLCTDASDFAVGAVLQQLENEGWKPIAFYSKKLNETQTRFQIFQLIHGLAHPGIKSTVKLMTEKYFWSDIKKQVREWAKACIRCQNCKVSRHTKSKLGEFEQPDERFSVVHIDLIGKLPPSEGMQVPAKLVTDQGRQFEAELFRSIAAICGAKVAHTTSYHPQCNGKVERLHRTLKGAINAHNNIRWTESLPTVLLGLRAAIRPDISYTIAQMVYSTSIKLPGEFFDPPTINMDPQNFVAELQQHMAELKPLKSPSNRKQNIFVHKDLKSCSHVFIRIDRVKKALEPPYEGPYTVQKNRLKPAYLLAVDNQNEQTSVGKKMRFQIGKNFPHCLMNNLLPAVAER